MDDEENHKLVEGGGLFRLPPANTKRRRYVYAMALMAVFFLMLVMVSSSSGGSKAVDEDADEDGSKPDGSLGDTLTEEGSFPSEGVITSAGSTEDESGEKKEDDAKSGDDADSSDREYYNVAHFAARCAESKKKNFPRDSLEYRIAAADCGWGYNFMNSTAKYKKWKVVLLGKTWTPSIIDLMGCSAYMICPLSPKCEISKATDSRQVTDADVVLIFQNEARDIRMLSKPKKTQYRVLYYREARFSNPPVSTQQLYDFEMGVHYYSGVIDPNFLRSPGQLMSGALPPFPPLPVIPLEKKTKFAISIISDCHAASQRDAYIFRLSNILGAEKVHRFGKCGDRVLPPKPINNAAKLIAEYKFYLAFENTIQEGYVTEKLFFVLNIPIVPVYLGALNAPNITTIPSFIRVSDFATPKHLADYLLHLDSHPEEYNSYNKWRTDPSLFDESFLEVVRTKAAGPEELEQYPHNKYKRFPRTAQCCRLCDENYVQWAVADRQRNLAKSMVTEMHHNAISNRFFGGKL